MPSKSKKDNLRSGEISNPEEKETQVKISVEEASLSETDQNPSEDSDNSAAKEQTIESDIDSSENEELEETQPDTPTMSAHVSGNMLPPKHSCLKAVFIWSILAFILGVLLTVGYFMWRDAVGSNSDSPPVVNNSQVVTPVPTATPVVTGEPGEPDLTNISVQVLNGSGIAGTAGDVATLLETNGFSSVEVGNADSSDYEETEVSLKPGVVDAVFEIVEQSLVDYEVVRGDELETSNTYDIVIIVGSN